MRTVSLISALLTTVLYASSSSAALKKVGDDEIPEDVRAQLAAGNYARAAPRLQELSRDGHREASYFLGQMYVCGKGVEFSCSNSARMFRASFEAEEESITDPVWVTSARSELAWLHAACEDQGFERASKAALRLAKAVTKYKADPFQLDTLAAAHASVGQYEQAVSTQERAVSDLTALARRSAVGQETINAFRQRLALYRVSKPARFSRSDAESECNALP